MAICAICLKANLLDTYPTTSPSGPVYRYTGMMKMGRGLTPTWYPMYFISRVKTRLCGVRDRPPPIIDSRMHAGPEFNIYTALSRTARLVVRKGNKGVNIPLNNQDVSLRGCEIGIHQATTLLAIHHDHVPRLVPTSIDLLLRSQALPCE